jgi:hypothetical protein
MIIGATNTFVVSITQLDLNCRPPDITYGESSREEFFRCIVHGLGE